MRDVMRYSGIVTKVAAMRAKLLKPQDYERLASMFVYRQDYYIDQEMESGRNHFCCRNFSTFFGFMFGNFFGLKDDH